MTREEWAQTLRAIATKASPVTAAIFRDIAARTEKKTEKTLADYMGSGSREPGEEG